MLHQAGRRLALHVAAGAPAKRATGKDARRRGMAFNQDAASDFFAKYARYYKPSMIVADPWAALARLPRKTPEQLPDQARQSAADFATASTHAALRSQIEYYFTQRNLEKDRYLRSLMDNDGWVAIDALFTFNRVSQLAQHVSVVRDALAQGLRSLQVNAEGTHVRLKSRPRAWVLPEHERYP